MSRHTTLPQAPPPGKPPLSPHEIRELSVHAKVHPTTIARYLRGAPVRSTVRARIAEALAERPETTHAPASTTAPRRAG